MNNNPYTPPQSVPGIVDSGAFAGHQYSNGDYDDRSFGGSDWRNPNSYRLVCIEESGTMVLLLGGCFVGGLVFGDFPRRNDCWIAHFHPVYLKA
jgi:hypothetical protein